MKRTQRGDFNLPRLMTICAILVAILLVPLYFWKDKGKPLGPRPAAAQSQAAVDPAAAAVNDPERSGLSFGWVAAPDSEALHASCYGEPKGPARQRQDSCNPHAGDTSCRTELPVLCARAADGNTPYALATAAAVAGFLLTSVDDGHARCAREFGGGWRMAGFHDGGGWDLRGQRQPGTAANTSQRVWVAIGDQRANCWDPP